MAAAATAAVVWAAAERAAAESAAAASAAGGWGARPVESASRNGLRARKGRQSVKHWKVGWVQVREGVGFEGVTLTQSVARVWVDVRAVAVHTNKRKLSVRGKMEAE